MVAGCSSGNDSTDTATDTATQEETTSGDSTDTETEKGSEGSMEITPDSVIHQTAGGEDIWDKIDKGHFFYTKHSGDFDVRVQVYSVEQGVNEYAKAGIMFRNSMDPGDVHVMTRRGPAGNSNVQWRPEKGAEAGSLTSDIGEGKSQLDNYFWSWHRLVREGDTIEFHVSSDGEEWQLMAELTGDDVALADEGYLGLAATSHNRAKKANFYYQGLEGVTPAESGDLDGPILSGSVEVLGEMPSDVEPPAEPEPAAEKVAHFTFDGDQITDQVSGNTGSMGGGVETGVGGVNGSAFKFNGEDGYATFPGTALDAEQATVTGWFNVSEHQEWSRVMQAGGSYEASPGETNGGWDLGFEGPTNNLAVTTYGSQKVRPTKHQIDYGKWYFVAVVFNGANVRMHLFDADGEVATVENAQEGRAVNGEVPITFFAGDTNYTAGMIDDVRGFNGPLSKDRITSIYEESAGGIPQSVPSADVHFTFDGDQVTDEVSGDTGSMGGGVETGASGQVGSAFNFNGEDGYATFPGTALGGEQATVAGWFNVSEHQEWSRVMQAGGSYEASPGETNGGWDLGFEGPTANLAVTTYGSQKVRPTKHEIEYGTWYFATVVFDGASVTLHLFDEDGKVTTVQNEQEGRAVLDSAPITFFAGDTHYTAGMIDEVKGFSTALSAGQAEQLYNSY